jgi:drug/metabolite transporter (DMT)-like permease
MKKYLAPAAVIFAAFLWSLDGFLRQTLSDVSSFTIVMIEHSIGALIFLPFLLRGWSKVKLLNQRTWGSVLWISICGGVLGTYFYTKALSYVNFIDLTVVVLLQKFQPVFAILLASVVLKERLTKRFMLLAVLALVGGYLVTFGLNPLIFTNDKMMIAALLSLLAAFSWGSSTVLGKHALSSLHFTTVTALRLTITAFITIGIFFLTQNTASITAISVDNWKTLLLIVVSTGSVALFIYYYGLKQLPASHTTIYELFWPLSAVLIDWLYRGRVLDPAQLAGAVLLLTAIITLTREPRSSLD